jgi:hypothetical protein
MYVYIHVNTFGTFQTIYFTETCKNLVSNKEGYEI